MDSPPVARSSGRSVAARPASIAAHHRSSCAAARPAGELLELRPAPASLFGSARTRGDERAIGNEPTGSDVLLARVVLASRPQLPRDRERLAPAHGVQAAQPAPRLFARGLGRRARGPRGTPRRRTRSCPARRAPSTSASRTSTRCSTSSAAYSSHDWGSGRVDQSDGGVRLGQRDPEGVLDDRAETDALVPEQARGQLGVEHRRGLEVRSRAATAGPGWPRAAPTPRRRSRPAARRSRRSAGGSNRNTPAPRRNTCTR